jgi:LmbE family N-acetylglucosaminyl deacetylase
MNIVSIMAHQDDEMYCLGTLYKYFFRGEHIHFVTLTDGAKGFVQNPEINPQEAAAIRHTEMLEVAGCLDAEYLNLNEPDEFLYDTPEVRMKLIEAIRHTKADVIFTHYHEDYNLDHTTVSSLVRHCAMQACLPVLPTASDPLPIHPAIFMICPHGSFSFPATHFVDVSDFEEKKGETLKLHRSQEVAMQQAVRAGFDALTRRLDAYWGQQVGCAYAEGFIPMRGRGSIKPYPVLP